LTDHYETLNITFGASETEIKKRFRKLATLHHPDKNGGSKKSEETFKVILDAYETLSDIEKRRIYDLKYKQHFKKPFSETTNKNDVNKKQTQPYQKPPRNREYEKTEKTKSKVNYSFWIVVVLIALLYLYNSNKTTTTGNSKADKQLEEEKPRNRPQSGELNFNK
jgi:curved DNA-binding protein CbpA